MEWDINGVIPISACQGRICKSNKSCGTIVMVVVGIRVTCRLRLVAPLFSIWLAVGCSSSSSEPSPRPSKESAQILAFDGGQTPFQVGYVPSDGLRTSIRVTNMTDSALKIQSIKTSCSCAVIGEVASISARDTVGIPLTFEGSDQPSARKVSLVVTVDGHTQPIMMPIEFFTGTIPSISPQIVALHQQGEEYVGFAKLWFDPVGQEAIELRCDGIIIDPSRVTVPLSDSSTKTSQLVSVPLKIAYSGDSPPPKLVAIKLIMGKSTETSTVRLEAVSDKQISVLPSSFVFTDCTQKQQSKRVCFVTGNRPIEVRVTNNAYCNVNATAVGPRVFKIEIEPQDCAALREEPVKTDVSLSITREDGSVVEKAISVTLIP